MDQEKNLKFMQIAMKYLPEAQMMLKEKGMEVNMDMMQPMLDVLLKVMNDAYELGASEAKAE
ncbi:ComZ family protein [Schinkia azotoformans]|nr:ComZ family protein [Schinkia azotoformans]MEC1694077.1 ComZ family protein [Schinkia azotoformans]MEC1724918.1 ComZ family protein [Schinkia azotoformans]MEC1780997.1 ComZ family protein [Schinkia azotoformans]MED4330477.1 ComZ family protein [Schinkia azotoformans]